MKKRMYRAIPVKRVDRETLADRTRGQRIAVGIDVAKMIQFAAIVDEHKEVLLVFKWNQLVASEHTQAIELLCGLSARSVEVAVEPSGTYGDPLCRGLEARGLPVYQVGPQRSQKYAEVYDGVPSQHDGKSAVLLARLHLEDISSPRLVRSRQQRDLAAAVSELELHEDHRQRNQNRIEAQLARHWPELGSILSASGASVLKMLETYGDPHVVATSAKQVAESLGRVGGHFLKVKTIAKILNSAKSTIGVPMTRGERHLLQELAREVLRSRSLLQQLKKRFQELSLDEPSVAALIPLTGLRTAVVLTTKGGDPRQSPHPAAFLKRLGLNLKERSSGRHRGRLRLAKRGSGVARKWLYLLTLRLIQSDAVVRTWYQRKIARDAGLKTKALTAVMRKIAKALWHVARGETFDSRRLFDTRRFASVNP